ncbi:prepilin-type N-terminal cleavage/methylation domain-containing protein [Lacticaseibacillus thailandensis]|uniref:Prepilin-type N-terminal cleavage/methylation domain-containing protein n=1 Tax=Lacticaseibacillus thailandensis DSM 22698 = JCM 13996 TaxID=1423810 RepID=A0A0R2CJR8_9LACO|nr:prepilin-type N-terminal cleavage/methylation domain-containing protein [Lacticaseibacillus thailandensis]KRM88342.1 hypothetical protein FD19_GL000636 [Lacticaseibacillus thailandensis DSM 22698 = JCM 13996]
MMVNGKRQRRGFTLIEVLAALAVIVILTITLIVTVKGQMQHAEAKNVATIVRSVNAQLEVQTPDMDDAGTPQSLGEMRDKGFISGAQYSQLVDAGVKVSTAGSGVTLKAPTGK